MQGVSRCMRFFQVRLCYGMVREQVIIVLSVDCLFCMHP